MSVVSGESANHSSLRRGDRSTPAVPGPEHAERLRRLQALTDAALAHLDLEQLLSSLLLRARELLDVDTCAVLLLDGQASELVARAAVGIEEEVERGVRIPVGRGFAGRVAAERDPSCSTTSTTRRAQSDPPREGHQVIAGRAAAGRRRSDRCAARRLASPSEVHGRRGRAPAARRRPRRPGDRTRQRLRGRATGARAA